jgi:hypothetical protein
MTRERKKKLEILFFSELAPFWRGSSWSSKAIREGFKTKYFAPLDKKEIFLQL